MSVFEAFKTQPDLGARTHFDALFYQTRKAEDILAISTHVSSLKLLE
jgi:hypothetical protein